MIYRPSALFDSLIDVQIKASGKRFITKRPQGLAPNLTTDPQAEMLIESEIPYEDIIFIACRNQAEHDLLASAFDILKLPTEKLCVNSTLFEAR